MAALRKPNPEGAEVIPAWTRVQLGDATFATLVRMVRESCGVAMSDFKKTMLETRLRRRLQATGLETFEDYVALLQKPDGWRQEGQNFVDAVVTNETSFFRERAHFDHFTPAEIQRLLANGDGRGLHVWSAAASSGQEAYTMAMVLDSLSEGATRFDWSVLATDISVKVLRMAREAVYRAEDVAPVPPALLDRYVLRSRDEASGTVRIAPELRQRVHFGQLNLMHAEYKPKRTMDVIFCRNVLIYFEPAVQEQVVSKLARHVRPGGLLILGHSDSLRTKSLPLRLVGNNIYERLGDR
ncbi:protein-glutamate O-methyltransferase CheR [Aureimonas sp. AU4]|uniref:CheR family methyltransferase n=1 Tax=Aureimonas sp. AU4 TaxID=1638163 RepID=UPI000780F5C2|nr:CheR family methyltransferase [Aureimonas sp. AU4]